MSTMKPVIAHPFDVHVILSDLPVIIVVISSTKALYPFDSFGAL